MPGRYSTNLATAIESGLDNQALALEEGRVGDAVVLTFDATQRLIDKAIADGQITRRERIDIRTHLAVVAEGLAQMVTLDRQDAEVGRVICGAHEGLIAERERASRELALGAA